MDQAQARALAAIQPFLYEATSAKSPTPRYLSDLITRATSAPGTYIFTELLQTPAIQSLRTADIPDSARSYLSLLEIFSWGTYEEYKATPNLPDLTPIQEQKLRQLTLLTLASPFGPPSTTSSNNSLTYASLLSSLSLPNAQSLESLLTTSIYSGLLTARLSPTSTPPTVHVTSVAPLRDLRPQSLPALLSILSTWSSRCEAVVSDLESQISSIQLAASQRNSTQKKNQAIVDAAVIGEFTGSDVKNIAAGGGGGIRLRNRLGNKRDLDESLDAEGEEEGSSDDLRMDLDEGLDVSGMGGGGGGAGGTRGGGAAGSSRGSKRGRGRG